MKTKIILTVLLIVLIPITIAIVIAIFQPRIAVLKDIQNKQNQIDSLKQELSIYRNNNTELLDSINILIAEKDSIQTVADSIVADNFVYKYKLGRIQNYLNIVKNNSSQSKYLKGWITRVLNE